MITLAEALAKVDEVIEDGLTRYERDLTLLVADPAEAAAMVRAARAQKRVERAQLERELRAWLATAPGAEPPVVPDRQVH